MPATSRSTPRAMIGGDLWRPPLLPVRPPRALVALPPVPTTPGGLRRGSWPAAQPSQNMPWWPWWLGVPTGGRRGVWGGIGPPQYEYPPSPAARTPERLWGTPPGGVWATQTRGGGPPAATHDGMPM